MIGATLCSGIGAPECAAPWIDWRWCAEVEPFPSAVHAARFPGVVNLGDITADDFVERAARVALPDVIVAGPPCQDFSIAGLRRSLDGDRGNLTLHFVRIIDAIDDLRRAAGLEPAWILWENVPGVFSTGDNAFGNFLGCLVGHDAPIGPPKRRGWTRAGVVSGPGRCAAWRVMDAQYVGLAQRRERVFVLARGGAGDWACADALLPVVESVRWHPAPSREAGPRVAALTANGVGTCGADDNQAQAGHLIATTLRARDTAKGVDSDCTDTLIPVRVFRTTGNSGAWDVGDATGSLTTTSDPCSHVVVGFNYARGNAFTIDGSPTVCASDGGHGANLSIAHEGAVRRLTPREVERLQGFPDDWTLVSYRGKPAADGPRYKAVGNSMAVPVLHWILDRVRVVNDASLGAAA